MKRAKGTLRVGQSIWIVGRKNPIKVIRVNNKKGTARAKGQKINYILIRNIHSGIWSALNMGRGMPKSSPAYEQEKGWHKESRRHRKAALKGLKKCKKCKKKITKKTHDHYHGYCSVCAYHSDVYGRTRRISRRRLLAT